MIPGTLGKSLRVVPRDTVRDELATLKRLGKRAAVLNPKAISMSDTVAVMTGAMPVEKIPEAALA